MLTFALALQKRGHEVLVASLPNSRGLFEENNIPFVEGGLDVKAWSAGKNLRQDNLGSITAQVKFLRQDLLKQFTVLLEKAKEVHAIFSGGYNMAAASIAEYYKIKHYHVFHVPNVYPTADHPCMMVPWQKLPKTLNRISWKLNSLNQNLCFKKIINEHRKKLGLPPISDVWAHLVQDSIMGVDPLLYEMPKRYQANHLQTGYWYPTIKEELPTDLLAFLAKENNVFYFGFGSMPTSEKFTIVKMIQEVCSQLNLRAIVSKGWANFDIQSNEQIYLAGKISHQKLFEKIRFAIHHGGPGTVSTAAKAGVPQIIIPHILDQFYWGERVHHLKAGPAPIKRQQFSSDLLLDRIKSLLNEDTYFTGALRLKDKLKHSDGMVDFFNPENQQRLGLDL